MSGQFNPPYGNGGIPIGCVANSRIVNMPAGYSISPTSAYPNVNAFFFNTDHTFVSGPYTYGRALVVTTDFGIRDLSYQDPRTLTTKPLVGSVTVSVCTEGPLSR